MTTTDKVQVGDSTTSTSTSTTASQWQTYKPPKAEQGWECPRCGRINAPWVRQCDCSPSGWTITTTTAADDEWWKPYLTSDTFRIHPESDPIYTVGGSDSNTNTTVVDGWRVFAKNHINL